MTWPFLLGQRGPGAFVGTPSGGNGGGVSDGGLEEPPVVIDVNGDVTIKGKVKAGSFGKFVYPLATVQADHKYTFRAVANFSRLAKQGKLAMVGFGFKDGNDFHIAGLRGDGSTGTKEYIVYGTAPNGWNKQTGHTEVDNGAAGAGTQHSAYYQLTTSADGATYTLKTSTDGVSYTTIETGRTPSPFTNVSGVTTFGIALWFNNTDAGPFELTITSFVDAPTISAGVATSPASRYHRINVMAASGGVCSIAEIEFWLNGTTKHSTAGKTVIASGTGAGTKEEVFDGNLATWWYSGGGTGWIGVDFGSGNAVAVGMIAMAGRSNTQYPTTWAHEYSSDGSTWFASGIGGSTGSELGRDRLYYYTDPAGGFMHTRLRWTADGTGAVRISAVEMRTSVGGADVSSTAIAKVTWIDAVGTQASLYDGNAATEWASNSFPATVQVYFPDNRTIAQVLLQAPASNIDQAPDELYIDTSPDGITWTTTFAETGYASWTLGETRTFLNYATSYLFTGGSGDRTASITATTNVTAGAGDVTMLVDGNTASNYWWVGGQGPGKFVRFDFGVGASKIIDEFRWRQDVGVHQGVWKMGGSNDGVTVTDFPETFNLGDANGEDIIPLTNATGYRYYHLLQVSGTTTSSPFVRECRFKIKDA